MKNWLKIFNIVFFLFLFSFAFSEENVSFEKQEDYNLMEIENKIKTNLFFRGEVADYIIENNLLDKITKENFSTYSSLRSFLLLWIKENPEKASQLYNASKKNDPLLKNNEIEIKISKSHLKKRFLDMVEDLKDISNNKNLSEESLRMGSYRVFEGFVDYGDGSIDFSNFNKEFSKNQNFIFNSNFKLNQSLLNQEENKMKEIYLTLKEEFLKNNKNKKEKFEILDIKYKNFLLFISNIKGRNIVNKNEAEEFKKQFQNLKKEMIKVKINMLIDNLSSLSFYLNKSKLKEDLLVFLQMTNENLKNNNDLFYLMNLLNETYLNYEDFLKEIYLNETILRLKKEIDETAFSGFFDFLVYKITYFFYPNNIYFLNKEKIKKYNLDLEKNMNLSNDRNLKDEEEIFNILKETQKSLNIISKISNSNNKMQFLSFELFWPFDLKIKYNKKYYIFLNYEILFKD